MNRALRIAIVHCGLLSACGVAEGDSKSSQSCGTQYIPLAAGTRYAYDVVRANGKTTSFTLTVIREDRAADRVTLRGDYDDGGEVQTTQMVWRCSDGGFVAYQGAGVDSIDPLSEFERFPAPVALDGERWPNDSMLGRNWTVNATVRAARPYGPPVERQVSSRFAARRVPQILVPGGAATAGIEITRDMTIAGKTVPRITTQLVPGAGIVRIETQGATWTLRAAGQKKLLRSPALAAESCVSPGPPVPAANPDALCGSNLTYNGHWATIPPGIVDLAGIANGGSSCTSDGMSCGASCEYPNISHDDFCSLHDDRDLEFHVTPYDTTLVTEGDRPGHRAPDVGVEWEAAYVYPKHPVFAAYDASLDYRRLVPNFFIDAMDPSFQLPMAGDPVVVHGVHIYDCGHSPTHSEIHPPLALAWVHRDSDHSGTVYVRASSHGSYPHKIPFGAPFRASLPVPDGVLAGAALRIGAIQADYAISNYQVSSDNGCEYGWTILSLGTDTAPVSMPTAHVVPNSGDWSQPPDRYFDIQIARSSDQSHVQLVLAPRPGVDTPVDAHPNLIGFHFQVCFPVVDRDGHTLNGCGLAEHGTVNRLQGRIEGVDGSNRLVGWVLDRRSPSRPTQLKVLGGPGFAGGPHGGTIIPHKRLATITADQPRPDVNATFGVGGVHGFAWPIPSTVKPADLVVEWVDEYGREILLDSNSAAITSRPMMGWLDGIDADGTARGWALDSRLDTKNSAVELYLDTGPPAGHMAGRIVAAGARPDVNDVVGVLGAHGYSWPLPLALHNGTSHMLYVYTVDDAGNRKQLDGSPRSFVLRGLLLAPANASAPAGAPATFTVQTPSDGRDQAVDLSFRANPLLAGRFATSRVRAGASTTLTVTPQAGAIDVELFTIDATYADGTRLSATATVTVPCPSGTSYCDVTHSCKASSECKEPGCPARSPMCACADPPACMTLAACRAACNDGLFCRQHPNKCQVP